MATRMADERVILDTEEVANLRTVRTRFDKGTEVMKSLINTGVLDDEELTAELKKVRQAMLQVKRSIDEILKPSKTSAADDTD